jgi:hypothetical protein
MTILTRILLALFVLDFGVLLLATVLWKKQDTELSSFFWGAAIFIGICQDT